MCLKIGGKHGMGEMHHCLLEDGAPAQMVYQARNQILHSCFPTITAHFVHHCTLKQALPCTCT